MSMDIYTPSENDIIHETSIDFVKRIIVVPIYLVQYDRSLPLVAVKLLNNGKDYVVPQNCDVWIKWAFKYNLHVKKKCMISQDRKTVYFNVDYEMTQYYGKLNPILELISQDDNQSTGSSPIPVTIDRNPVQDL